MNDVNVAAANNDEGMEARDFVEFGDVSAETKAWASGNFYDGGIGFWG
jgi:hypothetical protein